MTDVTSLVSPNWRERIGWARMTPDQRVAVAEYGFHMYQLASPTVSDIDEIKYDGRLVILEDGSRWEVGSLDYDTVDMWTPFTKVAVIDDVMYNLGEAEYADVSEEI